ncbi:hypothetical protein [Ideonella oryzae]|uniref:HTH luxR-type domain-containing protein n=1 Tax=Ideonella oryzae TaxID=2937441 RepID=A0ABT1BRZ8_9BURK|nr:hypothetical protein [Ideonella oryzae]MCO5979000.1 hypothetical protein [Ideonella oryzae]
MSRPPATMSMAALGLAAPAEALYRALLRGPAAAPEALAALCDQPLPDVQALLGQMKARGLVRSEGPEGRAWFATVPEVAVELLLMERQVELNQARQVLPELQRDLMRGGAITDADALQIIPADAESQLPTYLQMHQMAREEVVSMLCPPFIVSAPDAMEAAREQARQRGVRYRTLVVPELLQWSGWTDAVRQAHAVGDEVRVHAALPFKMVLADRHAGLIPLRHEDPTGPALRLGPTAALQALWMLFETLWAQAVPALAAEPGEGAAGETDPVDKDLHALVTLLAAGTNDKQIAGILGMSERTLLRRIHALSTQLNARSRFQCGWLAARHFSAPD